MAVSDLTPAPYNPREISSEALSGLRESIREFGLVQPVVWNERTAHVVGGHQRLKVLAADGVQDADVVVVDLPPSKEKALNVAMNNPHVAGEFTGELQGMLAELEEEEAALMESLRLDELQEDPPEPVAVQEVETGEVEDQFWITVRGPLRLQMESLERLRMDLEEQEGVTVALGVVER